MFLNVSVIVFTMEQAQNVGKECDQSYIQVTYDLTIAKIAYLFFIYLGSFHLILAFFKAVGTLIDECGLSHMIESKIVASGSVNGLIEGKLFNRCNPLMALGLQMLHFDQFLKSKDVEYGFVKRQINENLLEFQEKKCLYHRQRALIYYQMKCYHDC